LDIASAHTTPAMGSLVAKHLQHIDWKIAALRPFASAACDPSGALHWIAISL
jgi:hypothetical protein